MKSNEQKLKLISDNLKKAIIRKDNYYEANKEYLINDDSAINFTPNVAGRNNARIKRMDVSVDVYLRHIKTVEYWENKKIIIEDKIYWEKEGKQKQEEVKTSSLKEGTEVRTGNANELYSGKIAEVLKKSYKIKCENGKILTIKKDYINLLNK